MKKLILLDAYALIYRAYYAFLRMPRVNSKGQNTSAVFGFVKTLEDVIKRQEPSHIGVVFDPGGETFRHEAYKEYKATREETPEDIRLAIPYVKQIIAAHNIPVIVVPRYEADDVIGALAKKAEAKGFDVLMMTPDKDYGQLVTDKIHILRPGIGSKPAEEMGPQEVADKWGLQNAAQVVDLLALMGDVSDNVPGCPGVGEKTAVKLLQQFGSIDNMLAHTDQIKGALRQKVEDNVENIRFSKFLVTIDTNAPVEFNEEDFQRREPDMAELTRIYTELEFRTLLQKMDANELQPSLFKEATEGELIISAFTTLSDIEHNYECVDNDEKIDSLLARLSNSERFAFDTETTGVDATTAELVGMSFAIKENEAYYVPVPAMKNEAQHIVDRFREVLENGNIGKIGHNIKYDIMIMMRYGVEIKGEIDDTMVAHYLLQPEMRHGMDYLAEVLMKYQTIHIEQLIGGKGKGQLNMRDVPVSKVAEYAAEDADVTLKMYHILMPQLDEYGVMPLYRNVEMPLVSVLARMEMCGVLIDDFVLAQTGEQMNGELDDIEREIKKLAGDSINISSPRQVGELLFDTLHLVDKPKKTKTGQYVTDEETLEQLRNLHPVVGKILEYRGVKKLLSTYIEALPRLINPKTGRVHTSFNQTVTATGRLSSSNPNLQNIPVRGEQGREIRKAFIPTDGWRFISADYSQVELRLMAHFSQDENLLKAFRDDKDVHSATASTLFGVGIDDVTSDMRRRAKTINFGIIYGMSVFGMSERMSISRAEAKNFIDSYFANFSGVKRYMDDAIEKAKLNGYVETLLHRRRYLPDINSKNGNVRGFAERNAINAPIQGTAADIIKIAMVRIDERLRRENMRAEMILQVHDELNFNCPPDEVERLKVILREEMEGAYQLDVPLRVDIGEGDNWLEAH
ncbi:MAG: DNA polymerase I [Paludibacteraceae bacterium]|nr:DNA polymerase I [Paludibacteraceae bacterium]